MAKKKSSRGRGQPSKLTTAVRDAMCRYMRDGNYIETAAALVGVSKSSVYDWMKTGHKARAAIDKGKKPSIYERDCADFLDAIKKAEAEAEVAALRQIRAASAEAWQAAAWRLERRHPDRWGRRQAIEHSSPDDKPVKVQKIVIGEREIIF